MKEAPIHTCMVMLYTAPSSELHLVECRKFTFFHLNRDKFYKAYIYSLLKLGSMRLFAIFTNKQKYLTVRKLLNGQNYERNCYKFWKIY